MGKSIISDVVQDVEKKAKLRDYANSKVLTDEEMEQASELQSKAASRGMMLIPEKKIKNRAKFVQIIQNNFSYLLANNYLTNEEIVFLNKLIPYIGFGSNGIVEDISKKQPIALNQSGIADALKTSKTTVSRIIKSLVEKGIIARSTTGLVSNNARSYVLFINPHVMLSGERDKLNDTLVLMFAEAMTYPVLKDLPERFF